MKRLAAAGLALLAAAVSAAGAGAAEPDRYARAERFLAQNKARYLVNGDIRHHWIGEGDRFWYLRQDEAGARRFVVVEAETGEQAEAFDHGLVARGLAAAGQGEASPDALPFREFRFAEDGAAIRFHHGGGLWSCAVQGPPACRAVEDAARPGEALSPDGRWAAFIRDHDLWLRSTADGRLVALTRDGERDRAYADVDGVPYSSDDAAVRHGAATPQVLWSPDSRRLFTHRIDERGVRRSHLAQSAPEGWPSPRHFSYAFAVPGDARVPLLEPIVFDVETGARIDVRAAPVERFFSSLIVNRHAWWSADGRALYFIRRDRLSKRVGLNRVDPATGETREIIVETSDTWVRTGDGGIHEVPIVRTLANGEVLWFSERSGWGHLYRYAADGRLLNAVTSGDWTVRDIAHVDEAAGRLYVLGSGREPGSDPYDRRLYSVGLDGAGLALLTPEEAEHDVRIDRGFMSPPPGPLSSAAEEQGVSPSGRHFIDHYSRPDLPPVMVLRRADGTLVRRLETADIGALQGGGFVFPERFSALAADGSTPIYGVLLRPGDFDPSRSYPIIDSIYPGPQISRVWPGFSGATFDDPFAAQALAELGFIVVMLDGRGTPHRSRAFFDASYGRLGDAGNLDDHVAVIRQLAGRHPYIDLERVGIWGASGGGYATAHALLTRPEFFKVGVAAAGNHDQRGYSSGWGETYNGPADDAAAYDAAANPRFAANLRGRLLLIHGDMDENVNPALTMQLADRLVAAGRPFDLLIIPNGGHRVYRTPYALRATWDYFLEHLAPGPR